MADYDLCSAVFVLRPRRIFPANYHFLGRMVNKLFLLMLKHSGYGKLASDLHTMNTAMPFTVSDLFSSGSEHYWMRVTGLNSTVCQAVQHLVSTLPGQEMDVPPRDSVDEAGWPFTVEAAALSQHDWAGMCTCAELIDSTWRKPSGHSFTIEYITPTVIKSVGVFRPFPDPILVFRLLYERLRKIEGFLLPFEPSIDYLETYAQYFIEATHHRIACGQVPLKRGTAAAFTGLVTYRLLSENEDFEKRARNRYAKQNDSSLMVIYNDLQQQYDQYACLVNLLTESGFYSGLGMYTGQGMGMMRKVDGRE